MNAPHIVSEPSILYFGTPVVLSAVPTRTVRPI